MSFIWLVAWLIKRRPKVQMFKSWNNWGIALAVSLGLDLLSAVGRAPRRASHVKKLDTASRPTAVREEVAAGR